MRHSCGAFKAFGLENRRNSRNSVKRPAKSVETSYSAAIRTVIFEPASRDPRLGAARVDRESSGLRAESECRYFIQSHIPAYFHASTLNSAPATLPLI
jgi:hypothetical protein